MMDFKRADFMKWQNEQKVKELESTSENETKAEQINEDYLQKETKYGAGLGIKGLGRMVHLEEKTNKEGKIEFFYKLRKEKDKPRMDNISGNRQIEEEYEEDVYRISTPRISTALIEYVIDLYTNRIHNSSRNPILMKDMLNFLLVKELDDETVKTIVADALTSSKKNAVLHKLLDWNKERTENVDNGSYELQTAVIHSIDKQNSLISEITKQNKSLQEQNRQLAEQLYGITRTLAYQEGLRTGLVTASRINSTDELLGAMSTDATTRVVNAIHETGSNELKRQETIRNTQVRSKMD